jgi:hypothetical protein
VRYGEIVFIRKEKQPGTVGGGQRVPKDSAKAMRTYRFTRPPRAIRHAHLDNLALVPGSLLPYKREYPQLANNLPKGAILMILPETDQRLRQAVEKVAALLSLLSRELESPSQNPRILPAP